MGKYILIVGGIFSALTVIIGAFGAHALTDILEANKRLDTFDIAVKYQMFHSLGLVLLGVLQKIKPNKLLSYSALLMSVGILLFSGSLFVLAIFNLPFMGVITPFGGLAFISGWILMIFSQLKNT